LAAFLQTDEQARGLRRNADNVVRAMKAGEQWRADVRSAVSKPHADGAARLRIRQANGFVEYAFREGAVLREADGKSQRLLSAVHSCMFAIEQRRHVAAWRWDLELVPARKHPRMRPLFTFRAAPPGGS
jgi:hypothetical protein